MFALTNLLIKFVQKYEHMYNQFTITTSTHNKEYVRFILQLSKKLGVDVDYLYRIFYLNVMTFDQLSEVTKINRSSLIYHSKPKLGKDGFNIPSQFKTIRLFNTQKNPGHVFIIIDDNLISFVRNKLKL